jgi:hypothetical protein
MPFELSSAIALLARTPEVLDALLRGLPADWTGADEGPGKWSPFDVLGHLIHGERTDWIPRVEHVLVHGDAVPFSEFDRVAMFEASKGKALEELLDTFRKLRAANLRRLVELGLGPADLEKAGWHPDLGPVTLGQHLATWVAHDLDHLGQIARVLARRHVEDVGPWRRYLRILG